MKFPTTKTMVSFRGLFFLGGKGVIQVDGDRLSSALCHHGSKWRLGRRHISDFRGPQLVADPVFLPGWIRLQRHFMLVGGLEHVEIFQMGINMCSSQL